jgi:hypothetical protein
MNNLLKMVCLLLFSPVLIYSQLLNDLQVNTDTNLSQPKYNAKISTGKNGTSVVVWEHWGATTSNVYAQIFDNHFNRILNNFRVNSVLDTSFNADVAVRKDGSFGIIWRTTHTYPGYYSTLLFKIFNKEGIPITNEININNSIYIHATLPRIVCDTNNRFIITFQHPLGNFSKPDVFYQITDSGGTKIGGNVKVNEGNNSYGKPVISVRKDGKFMISWEDIRYSPPPNIFCQFYNSDGTPIGVNQQVNDIEIGIDTLNDQSKPDITIDSLGRFIIAFRETPYSTGVGVVKYQRYDTSFNKIGNNKTLPGTLLFNAFSSDLKGNLIFQLGLDNYITGYVLNLRIDSDDNVIGTFFYVSNQYVGIRKGCWDIYLYNDKIINVWGDLRHSNQPQVFLNVRSYINPDSVVKIHKLGTETPEEFSISQNYPNPFNLSTMFDLHCAEKGHYIIEIYDITGKRVRTVLNEVLEAGFYSIRFDAGGLSSGIYFCKVILKNKKIISTKMILTR